jgi:hypothetical protein
MKGSGDQGQEEAEDRAESAGRPDRAAICAAMPRFGEASSGRVARGSAGEGRPGVGGGSKAKLGPGVGGPEHCQKRCERGSEGAGTAGRYRSALWTRCGRRSTRGGVSPRQDLEICFLRVLHRPPINVGLFIPGFRVDELAPRHGRLPT